METPGENERKLKSGPGPSLQVLPQSSLNDHDLTIIASGLHPDQIVTLQAHVFTESGHRFESRATYRSNASGVVDVRTDPSVGGSYTGVERMGLIWSLSPSRDAANQWPRLAKRDVKKPFVFTFKLVDDHDDVLHSVVVERRYLADYVDCHPVSHRLADGCLYIPKQKGKSDPLPVIIEMRGGVTIVAGDRPSLLASHGFATFSVDYYMKMGKIVMGGSKYFNLQMFLDIYDFVVKHPRLDEHRVGILSSCLGSVLAMQGVARLGERFPVRCISTMGCLDFLGYDVGLKLPDGSLLDPYDTYMHYDLTEEEDGSHVLLLRDFSAFDNLEGEFLVPVEDISCPMLFLINGDDQYIPSQKRMLAMKEKIERAGNGHLIEAIALEGAGHFIDAPYLPLCQRSKVDSSLPYPIYSYYGGEKRLHAYSLNKAWKKIINWFGSQLGVTEVYRKDWLDSAKTGKTPELSRL